MKPFPDATIGSTTRFGQLRKKSITQLLRSRSYNYPTSNEKDRSQPRGSVGVSKELEPGPGCTGTPREVAVSEPALPQDEESGGQKSQRGRGRSDPRTNTGPLHRQPVPREGGEGPAGPDLTAVLR